MAPRYELEKWQLGELYDLYKKGNIELHPDYQRSRVWSDEQRYELIYTAEREWPMGLLMFNVREEVDDDNVEVLNYDVVDGQQRTTTLFEYFDGVEWGKAPAARQDFTPYKQLSQSAQARFDRYRVAVALMRDYEESDILEVYSRLQRGKPLVIGEKVKALNTGFHPFIEKLAKHRIFAIAGGRHRRRDGHWNLASLFFKSVYRNNPLDRHEYKYLDQFLRYEPVDARKAEKAQEETARVLTYEVKVIDELLAIDSGFDLSSARVVKWLFVVLRLLMGRYALSGREHLAAKGVHEYFAAKDAEDTDEWKAYTNTGRSGKIDTDKVKECLEQLMNRIIIAAEAEPLDPQRFFTPDQRSEIFTKSNRECAHCKVHLSPTNFHADHVRPHTHGGPTTVDNGQALCTLCNRKKGGNPELFKLNS
jgi:hypothetical protein